MRTSPCSIRIANGSFERADSASKSKNSPFHGWTMKGKAVMTVVAGTVVWSEQNELAAV